MQTDPLQPSCITLRYGSKRYLLCADEVTNFLINCGSLGLTSPDLIIEQLELIANHIKLSPLSDTMEHERSMALLKEVALSIRGSIFDDQ